MQTENILNRSGPSKLYCVEDFEDTKVHYAHDEWRGVSETDKAKIIACHKIFLTSVSKKVLDWFPLLVLKDEDSKFKTHLETAERKFTEQATGEHKAMLMRLIQALSKGMRLPNNVRLWTFVMELAHVPDLATFSKYLLSPLTRKYSESIKAISQVYVDNIVRIYSDERTERVIIAYSELVPVYGFTEFPIELLQVLHAKDKYTALKKMKAPQIIASKLDKIFHLPEAPVTSLLLDDLKDICIYYCQSNE